MEIDQQHSIWSSKLISFSLDHMWCFILQCMCSLCTSCCMYDARKLSMVAKICGTYVLIVHFMLNVKHWTNLHIVDKL
jgi:hypothetical protein